MPEEFENTVLFLRLGLPSTLIGHKNGAFQNAVQTGGLENAAFLRFSEDGKHFDSFPKR